MRKTLLSLLSAALVSFAVLGLPAPGSAQDTDTETETPPPPPATPPPAGTRELDTASPTAKALKELLHVDPRYAKDETVELVYEFADDGELQDFDQRGFDMVQRDAVPIDGDSSELTLITSSQGQGILQHRLEMLAPYEVTVKLKLGEVRGSADFVFTIGKSGGARLLDQFAERTSRGFKPVGKPRQPVYEGLCRNTGTVRYVVTEDTVSVQVNGADRGSTKKFAGGKANGKFGVWMAGTSMHIGQITIKGKFDGSKL